MMEIIEVAKYIRKELKAAEQYAYEACKHKEQYPELAQKYYRASQEHLSLAEELHSGASRLIEEVKRRDQDEADDLHMLWTYEHDMMLEEKECILRKLEMYKA